MGRPHSPRRIDPVGRAEKGGRDGAVEEEVGEGLGAGRQGRVENARLCPIRYPRQSLAVGDGGGEPGDDQSHSWPLSIGLYKKSNISNKPNRLLRRR